MLDYSTIVFCCHPVDVMTQKHLVVTAADILTQVFSLAGSYVYTYDLLALHRAGAGGLMDPHQSLRSISSLLSSRLDQ